MFPHFISDRGLSFYLFCTGRSTRRGGGAVGRQPVVQRRVVDEVLVGRGRLWAVLLAVEREMHGDGGDAHVRAGAHLSGGRFMVSRTHKCSTAQVCCVAAREYGAMKRVFE